MAIGYLRVIAQANELTRIAGVQVEVSRNGAVVTSAVTGPDGMTPLIALETVGKEVSLDPNASELPFYLYRVKIEKEGYRTVVRDQVTIFDGETSTLTILMQPLQAASGFVFSSQEAVPVISTDSPILPTPIIPNVISVKLGTPQSDAPVIKVDYVYYIKNVASSEIYPTWPEAAMRANIYAIQSIALNRLYTEWYRQRGYPFQITASPAYDQKFIPDRVIYDSIARIVDETYRQYIHRIGFVEPLFAMFCDGRTVQCDGLHQWETVDLANQGKTPLEILQHFYGEDIEIVESLIIQDITERFKEDLMIGSVGPEVLLMQIYLLRISVNYPAIPQPFPLDGVYSHTLEESVREFQKIFNLPQTGVIDRDTWYKISYIYHAVKRSAELRSEGLVSPIEYTEFAGTLAQGSSGTRVLILQYTLNVLSQHIDALSFTKMDAKFGPVTRRNVEAFQRHVGLPVTGVVDEMTWETLVKYYQEVFLPLPVSFEVMPYPGRPLTIGDQGLEIQTVQQYLNTIARNYSSIQSIPQTGVFDETMARQVESFQKEFNLEPTGVIDEQTWNRIVTIYRAVIPIVLYGGYDLRYDDIDYRVAVLQDYLNTIATVYPHIPTSVVDEWFGPQTLASVRAFQQQFGLPDTGVVDKATWNKILEIYSEVEFA